MKSCVLWILFIFFAKGIVVKSEGNVRRCAENSDCPRSKTCLQGYCKSPCMEICGPQALCAVMNHKAYCFCKDESDDCIPRKVTRKCFPECKKNSVCNTDIGFCECKWGYQGNPYRGCLKKCATFHDCSLNEICSGESCKNPCEEDCGIQAACVVVNQTSICSCPAGYTGNSFEICRPIAESLILTKNKICNQCKEDAECVSVGGITRCFCPRGYIGNPYKMCNKMCLSNSDCPVDKICSTHICIDPCIEVCGVNAKCTVDSKSRKPKCMCGEGFSGDPSRICTTTLATRFADPEDELKCHPKCGTNASCNTKYGICTCNTGHIGNPYGHCRKKCASDSDCPVNESCYDGDCNNPCLYACGKNAICRVESHIARCRCPYGFNGDAMKICQQVVTTQPSIVEVDLCDSVTCGTNAKCQPTGQETCKCLPGYNGNPYTICSKTCRIDSDCLDDEACKGGTCRNACINSCGLNSICKTKRHIPSCQCPDNYKGDASRICFPNAKGVLLNPSRVPCLKCICRSITGNNDIFACAEKSINFAYWAFAGEDLAGGENFRTRNSTVDFLTCMNDKICIFNTMNDYTSRALHRLSIKAIEDKLSHFNNQNYGQSIVRTMKSGIQIKAIEDILSHLNNQNYGQSIVRTMKSGIQIKATEDILSHFNNQNYGQSIVQTMKSGIQDINCDGEITCADYFAVHKFGLTAKFNDSIFNTSEARSFDQCEDHGEIDVTGNWTPKKCIGPSYVDILS